MMWIYREIDQFGGHVLFVWRHRWQLQLDVGTGIDIDAPCKVQGWEIRNCLGKIQMLQIHEEPAKFSSEVLRWRLCP